MRFFSRLALLLGIIIGTQATLSRAEDMKIASLRQRLGSMVIVPLAKPLDPKSHNIFLQNYIRDGLEYIPVFTSDARLKKSLKGATPPTPMVEIDRRLFFSMLSGKETIVFDASLLDELQFSGSILKSEFLSDIRAWDEKEKKLSMDNKSNQLSRPVE